jgi:phosphatidylglycerol:prolipoprotein diacylglycerol transferase
MTAPTARPALDRWISAAHAAAERAGTHPHQAAWGAALLGLPVLTGVLGWFLADRPWVPAVGVVLVLVAYHHGYLRLKRAWVPGARRQLLMDLTLFCLPAFLAWCLLAGESMRATTDLVALVLPWAIVVLRLGCFLGGCCHGRPARWGVLHPGAVTRRVPLPLFEMFVAATLALLLPLSAAVHDGPLLARFALLYGGYRFVSEFFRGPEVRRTGGLTRSQVLAASVAILGGVWW